jgi:hypothetical protein
MYVAKRSCFASALCCWVWHAELLSIEVAQRLALIQGLGTRVSGLPRSRLHLASMEYATLPLSDNAHWAVHLCLPSFA